MTSYRRTWHLIAAFLAWTVLIPMRQAHAFQATAGAVQGKVVLDSDGSAVSGVTITLVRLSATPGAVSTNPLNSGTVTTTPISGAGTPGGATTATATSAKDGSFSATGLAAGQFAVCVKDPNAAVIDPCLWTDSRTAVTSRRAACPAASWSESRRLPRSVCE